MSQSKKQSFLHGAAWLAMATAIVKVIGALYKIPLGNVIGDAGFGYFNTAYDIYSVLLMVSTAGLPVAMSRMIAEANSLGCTGQIKRIYSTARTIFLTLGLTGSIFMTVFCRQLAGWMNSPNSWAAIAALGPATVLMCLTSSFRGFFQGQGNMRPTSISQVLEAFCKLFIGLGLAYVIMVATQDTPLAAGGAILGVTTGSLVAVLFMYSQYHSAKKELVDDSGPVLSRKATAKRLLAIAVPITLGSAGLQIINLIDTKIVMSQLIGPAGFTQEVADTVKGIYNFTQTIFNLPGAFVTPMTISVIPAITERLTLKRPLEAKATEESAIRVTTLLVAPCAVGLCVLSQPILALLRGYSGENLMLAGNLLSILGFTVVLNSLVLLTNAIMQAHGNVVMPVVNMIVGGIIKVIVNYILVGNPAIHIQGAPIGTLCCYTAITALNILALRRTTKDAPAVIRNLFKPMLAAILMGVVTFFAWKGLALFTSSRILLCGGPIAVAVVVYVALIFILRPLTYADCMLLPKGEKIAKILRVKR